MIEHILSSWLCTIFHINKYATEIDSCWLHHMFVGGFFGSCEKLVKFIFYNWKIDCILNKTGY